MTIYKIQKKTHLDEYDRSYYNIFTVTPKIKSTEKIHAFLKEIPTKKLSHSITNLPKCTNVSSF